MRPEFYYAPTYFGHPGGVIAKKSQLAGLANCDLIFGDPGEARTLDPLIKSQLLYQLSYGVIIYFLWKLHAFLNCVAKVRLFFELSKKFGKKICIFCIFDFDFRLFGTFESFLGGKLLGERWNTPVFL